MERLIKIPASPEMPKSSFQTSSFFEVVLNLQTKLLLIQPSHWGGSSSGFLLKKKRAHLGGEGACACLPDVSTSSQARNRRMGTRERERMEKGTGGGEEG